MLTTKFIFLVKICPLQGFKLEVGWCTNGCPPCCLFGWCMSVSASQWKAFFEFFQQMSTVILFFSLKTADLFRVSFRYYGRSILTEVLGFQIIRKLFLLLTIFTCVMFVHWKVFALWTFCGEDLIITLSFVNYGTSEGNLTLLQLMSHITHKSRIYNYSL